MSRVLENNFLSANLHASETAENLRDNVGSRNEVAERVGVSWLVFRLFTDGYWFFLTFSSRDSYG